LKATDILMEEHRVIERVIAALEAGASQLEQGKAVRPEFFMEVAAFIKGFADGCHHKKEEGVLFQSMFAFGAPQQGGPVNVMLAEHEMGRTYTRGLRSAAERLAGGDQNAIQEVIHFARNYAALLRQHILKEDRILFPMANEIIPEAYQEQVYQGFERVEHEETGEGIHEKYLALAESLEKEVGIS
jgi:hemerythrin-like domain-containing protein